MHKARGRIVASAYKIMMVIVVDMLVHHDRAMWKKTVKCGSGQGREKDPWETEGSHRSEPRANHFLDYVL